MTPHSDWTDGPRTFRDEVSSRVAGSPALGVVVDRADVRFGRRGIDAGRAEAAMGRFSSKVRRLPTFARTYTSHEAVAHGTPGGALGRIMRSLEGKFVVANRPCSVSLPSSVRETITQLHALCRQEAGARRILISLAEPGSVVIRHADRAGGAGHASSPPGFLAFLPYEVTFAIGANSSANAESLIAAARTIIDSLAPDEIDWFNVGLCIPDRDALEQMTGEAALFYRGITGRLGAGTPERYWHLDAWEQYTEPGRMHGFIVPEFLRLPQYSPEPPAQGEPRSDAAPSYGSSLWPALTKRLVKRALIPPGYCFVEFCARVSIRVCGVDA